jgi:hypothetical protein
MSNSHSIRQNISLLSRRILKLFSISFLLFTASPNYAIAYGGHGYSYGHGYGHHGYGHHRYRGHYSHHGGIGTAGYVFLGILGVAILSQVLDNNNDRDRRYRESRTYNQPRPYKPSTQPRRGLVEKKPKPAPVYKYSENEGWDSLAEGNANYALDIFAIQSQQNLDSGIPKIGFAIAAAKNGELERAIRTMRKAIRVDAAALDQIDVINIKPTIEALSKDYEFSSYNNDNAFMLATLSYMQKDYGSASAMISEKDHSESANNLRALINNLN